MRRMRVIQLTQGKVANVDAEDYDRLNQYNWAAKKCANNWYAQRLVYLPRPDGKKGAHTSIMMHQEVLGHRGRVDHRDMNGLNNRKGNLRKSTRSQNLANARKRVHASSRYKGVSWDNEAQKWRSRITVSGKTIALGRFEDEKEAAAVYDTAARRYFGEFARTNLDLNITGSN